MHHIYTCPLLFDFSPNISQSRWTYALSVEVNDEGNSSSIQQYNTMQCNAIQYNIIQCRNSYYAKGLCKVKKKLKKSKIKLDRAPDTHTPPYPTLFFKPITDMAEHSDHDLQLLTIVHVYKKIHMVNYPKISVLA